MQLYCVQCHRQVDALLMAGSKIYPHRPDLSYLTFYQCPKCGNYVGTHRDGRPLGTIPTPDLRAWRHKVHETIDAYWLPTKDRAKRKRLYKAISAYIGREYHTGEINSVEECRQVIGFYQNFKNELQ